MSGGSLDRRLRIVLVVAAVAATVSVMVLSIVQEWPAGGSLVAVARVLHWLLLGGYACLPVILAGCGLRRLLGPLDLPPVLGWAVVWISGWAAVIVVGVILLAAGLYTPVAWQVLAAAGTVLAAIAAVRRPASVERWRDSWQRGRALLAWWGDGWAPWRWALAGLLVAAAVCAMLPPTSRDEVTYHLVAPRLWAAAGGWLIPGDNPHLLFPGNVEIVWSWALAVGGLRAPRLITLVWAVLSVAVLWEWLREREVDPSLGQALLLLLVATPAILHSAPICYVEWPLLLMILVGWRASHLRVEKGGGTAAILAAGAWSLALGSKHAALPVVLLLVLEWWLRLRRESPRSAGVVLPSVALTASALAAPWWVRAWFLTGDPLFPFGSLLARGGSAAGEAAAIASYARPGGAWRLFPWAWHAGAEPLGDQMLHPLWPVLLLAVIGLGWRWRRTLPWLTVLAASAVLVPFGPAPRVYAPLMLLSWLFLPRLLAAEPVRGAWRVAGAAAVAGSVCLGVPVVLASWFLDANRAAPDYLLGQVGETGFLERGESVTPVTEWVRTRTPPDARVWAWGEDRAFYLDRWVRASSPYARPSFVAAAALGVAGLDAEVESAGVDYVLVNRLRVPEPWTRVELDGRTHELSPREAAVLEEWRLGRLREVVRDQRYLLFQVVP